MYQAYGCSRSKKLYLWGGSSMHAGDINNQIPNMIGIVHTGIMRLALLPAVLTGCMHDVIGSEDPAQHGSMLMWCAL